MGVLHFMLDGRKEELHVYQNVKLSEQEPYRNHFFVPFTDLTNGEETCGAGATWTCGAPGRAGGTGPEQGLQPVLRIQPPLFLSDTSCGEPPALRVTAGVLKFHD